MCIFYIFLASTGTSHGSKIIQTDFVNNGSSKAKNDHELLYLATKTNVEYMEISIVQKSKAMKTLMIAV